jgi:hypothetical protein
MASPARHVMIRAAGLLAAALPGQREPAPAHLNGPDRNLLRFCGFSAP